MSTHDRGAFGQLLAEAKERGATGLEFDVDLLRDDPEDINRWQVDAYGVDPLGDAMFLAGANGRTGEEALRRLVEAMRGQ